MSNSAISTTVAPVAAVPPASAVDATLSVLSAQREEDNNGDTYCSSSSSDAVEKEAEDEDDYINEELDAASAAVAPAAVNAVIVKEHAAGCDGQISGTEGQDEKQSVAQSNKKQTAATTNIKKRVASTAVQTLEAEAQDERKEAIKSSKKHKGTAALVAQNKYTVYYTDECVKEKTLPDGRKFLEYKTLRTILGGYIASMPLSGGMIALFDEEGLLKRRDYNARASAAVQLHGVRMDFVGTVIIMPSKMFK
jgi:hypothetical protein